jgi:uncharacterized repeat protein (TIGR03843 family)
MDIAVSMKFLQEGELCVTGRLVDASNATLFGKVTTDVGETACIYKPVAGERPLWDFPDGTLADREFAAYLVSEFLQLSIVPPTLLRDGPYGFGMVQEWIDIDESVDLGALFTRDIPELRNIAFFDAIINNTDRKIGHLLPTPDGKIFGCDHGVTFHEEDKLRTVLWQWSGDVLSEQEISLLNKILGGLDVDLDLSPYLTQTEILALRVRVEKMLESGSMPRPNPDWPAVPWPAF